MTRWPDQAAIRFRLSAEVDRMLAILDGRDDIVEMSLLGSLVDGAAHLHAGSDIDLMVVQDTGRPPIDRALAPRGELDPHVPVDLFVYTPDELATRGRFVAHVAAARPSAAVSPIWADPLELCAPDDAMTSLGAQSSFGRAVSGRGWRPGGVP